jgi:hypothetical protein
MTVKELVYDALRLIGVIEVAQGPSPDEFNELLRILNTMLDAWRTERLMAYTIISTAYTVGADGSVRIPHAVRVEGIWVKADGFLGQARMLNNQTRYLGGVFNDEGYPTSALWFNPPIPVGMTVAVETWIELLAFSSINDPVLVPQGYLEAMEYNLALRIAPRYKDAMVSPLVLENAATSKANIKRMNRQTPLLELDRALLGGGGYGDYAFSGVEGFTPGGLVGPPDIIAPPVPPDTGQPDRQDLAIYQGDSYVAYVTVAGGDDIIAGYAARAQIRTDVADAASAVVVEMDTVVASPNVTISIPPDKTATLTDDSYVWDLQVTSPAGVVTTLLRGNVEVLQEVTR